MKIDLPITIIFDCQATDAASIMRAAGHVIGTLRYETDGDGRDAVLFGSYPPNDKPFLVAGRMHTPEGEPAQGVLAFIPAAADKKINSKAARWPEDYMVGTEEEIAIAQEDANDEAAQNSQFGAGA